MKNVELFEKAALIGPSSNTVWHRATVTRQRREAANGHRSAVVWFTGLSGSGKSTLAHAVEEQLHQAGCGTFVLDGDNVRYGLCSNLGFSNDDRPVNIHRIGGGLADLYPRLAPTCQWDHAAAQFVLESAWGKLTSAVINRMSGKVARSSFESNF